MKNNVKPIENFTEEYVKKSYYPYDPETGKKCFDNIAKKGSIKFYEIFMLWFPEYYFYYRTTFETILENKECYFNLSWIYYMGIMAASTIRSQFLLRHLESEFLLSGGEEDWLIYGLDSIPEKLKKLQIINNILAHQPWKLKVQDLNDLCSGNSATSWNIENLVQCVIILTNFHRLASVLVCLKIGIKDINSNFVVDKKNDSSEEGKN